MEKSVKKPRFIMEMTMDEKGQVQTKTIQEGMPYELVVSALSQQLYLYNKLWAEKSSTSFSIADKK